MALDARQLRESLTKDCSRPPRVLRLVRHGTLETVIKGALPGHRQLFRQRFWQLRGLNGVIDPHLQIPVDE
jgi:hypothetical protein